MRVSTQQQYASLKNPLLDLQGEMLTLQQRISTGKRVQVASDDPFASISIMIFRSAKGLSTQHLNTAKAARTTMAYAESSLGEMESLMKRAKVLAIQGANSATDQDSRQVMVSEIRTIQSRLVELGNSQDQNGNYLFAGQLSKTKPFVPSFADPTQLNYNGDTNQQYVEVGPGMTVQQNVILNQQMTVAFDALEDLAVRLSAGDLSGISGVSLAEIDSSMSGLRLVRGNVGAAMNQMENAAEMAQKRIDQFIEQISEQEDADMTETITDLQNTQTAYQAALAAFSGITRMSLLDYLR